MIASTFEPTRGVGSRRYRIGPGTVGPCLQDLRRRLADVVVTSFRHGAFGEPAAGFEGRHFGW